MTEPAAATDPPPLQVSLDVTAIPPSTPAGAGRYVLCLAEALTARTDLSLTLLASRGDGERWNFVEGGAGRSVLRAGAPGTRPLRLAWEQVVLPRLLARSAVQVHHSPHYTMPEMAKIPVVVTVHDCTFLDHPEWHERSKVVLFRRAIKVAARRAAGIVCDSESTADRLQELVDVRGFVSVAHLGVDLVRFRPDEPVPGRDEEILDRMGMGHAGPFVLYLGTVEPRKGIRHLVEAFDQMAPSHPELTLVIAGKRGWGPDLLGDALAAARHRDRVRVLGYVPGDAVPALMRRAAVVAYPALEEGFGLPALETLACGTPLVTTSGTAMADFAGDAAWLAPPASTRLIRQALESVVSGDDSGEVEAKRRKGLEIAAEHTWERVASIHAAAYARAAGA